MLQHVVRLAVYSSMLSGMSRLRWEQSKQKTLTKFNFVQKMKLENINVASCTSGLVFISCSYKPLMEL